MTAIDDNDPNLSDGPTLEEAQWWDAHIPVPDLEWWEANPEPAADIEGAPI